MENADKVPYIINALSDILRYSIIKQNDFVTINGLIILVEKLYVYSKDPVSEILYNTLYILNPDMQSYKIPCLFEFIENSLLQFLKFIRVVLLSSAYLLRIIPFS